MPFITFLLSGLLLLGGCAPLNPPAEGDQRVSRRPYVSEVDLPEAKAFFGYAQFRLLIVDNRWEEAIAALERAVAFDPESSALQLTLAKAYLHNQQLDEGGSALEALLQKDPGQLAGWELLGELRTYQERYPEALAAYREAIQQSPAGENLRLRLIAIHEQQGDLVSAIAETNTLLGLSPDSVPGQLALARLQRRNSQAGEAIKTYRKMLVKSPGQLQVVLELGQLLEREQQVGQAVDLYRETITDNPELLAVYKQLARILVLQERYTEALTLLQQAHQQRPEDVQILTRMGLIQLSREDYTGGEESFRKILALQPDTHASLYSLGMALVGQHRNLEALKVLQQIPKSSEVYPEAVLQVGYLYRQEGELEKGIEILQEAVDQGRQPVDTYYYLSAFLGETGRFAAAGVAVRAGLEHFPQDARLRYQLGVIYERMDDRSKALEEMEAVLVLDPLHADALNFIAYHYAERGENLEQALVQAKLALEQKQTSYIFDTLGWIHFRMQNYAAARENLEKAILLDPEDPLINEHLGDINSSLQRWSEAEGNYRKALELDKDATSARDKLQRLLQDHPPQ